MTQPDRRSNDARLPATSERRRSDRRGRQAAVLDHRRATDRRLDAAGADLLLQRSAFVSRLRAPTAPAPVSRRLVELDARRPEAPAVLDLTDDDCTELVTCPLCSVLFDPLWLFQHVAVDH